MNILKQPYTNAEYAQFVSEANGNGQRVERHGDVVYRLYPDEVVKDGEIVKNPEYEKQKRIADIPIEIAQIEADFEAFKQTPIVYPVNGNHYKPVWADDGTYIKCIVGLEIAAEKLGIENPTQLIWDATNKEENAVNMTLDDVVQLTMFLRSVAEPVYLEQKRKKETLNAELEELTNG